MYCVLNLNYYLRGWRNQPAVLIKRPNNQIRVLSQLELSVLLLCDGSTPLSEIYKYFNFPNLINEFIKDQVVSLVSEPVKLTNHQFYKYYNNHLIKTVQWSITGECNYKCKHCYLSAPLRNQKDISHKEAMLLIDQFVECGVLVVNLTGGEPLLREDLWCIVDKLTSNSICIDKIYTNGSLVDIEFICKLIERGLCPQIIFSYDCVQSHDWLRGVDGAEASVVEALSLCQRFSIRTGVSICVYKDNIANLPATLSFLQNFNVRSIKVSQINTTDLWKKYEEAQTLDMISEIEIYKKCISSYFEHKMPYDLTICSVFKCHHNSVKYSIPLMFYNGTQQCLKRHICNYTHQSAYISSEGRLLPCMPYASMKSSVEFPVVIDASLADSLNDSKYTQYLKMQIADLFENNAKCQSCKFGLYCGGGCRANAQIYGGNICASDSIACALLLGGYIDDIIKTADSAINKLVEAQVSEDNI